MGCVALAVLGGACELVINLPDSHLRVDGAGGAGGSSSASSTGGGCSVGETMCASGCVDMSTSPTDCGQCGKICATPTNGVAGCTKSTCGIAACTPGYGDCNQLVDDGCELSVTSDKAHCGECGTTCFLSCSKGVCNDPIAVSAGGRHTCALLRDGSVWCWGRNKNGELGDGTFTERHAPTKVDLPGPVIQVSAGGDITAGIDEGHTCAVLNNGTVYCWGANGHGQRAGVNAESKWTPTQLGLTDIKLISAGGIHTCAVRTDGDLYCWGADDDGEVGNGITTTIVKLPVKVATDIAQVAAGARHTCAVTTTGEVYCWGYNVGGSLGLGTSANMVYPSPVLVPGLTGVEEIATGLGKSCARSPAGVFCWGQAFTLSPSSQYVQPATSIDLGSSHVGAVIGGTVWTWGKNELGQLGFPVDLLKFLPPKATSVTNATKVTAGYNHTCALRANGQILCWGSNEFGQLGDGTLTDRSAPALVVFP
jgi:hypothetical protein